jgi:hypothetical protein
MWRDLGWLPYRCGSGWQSRNALAEFMRLQDVLGFPETKPYSD